MQTGQVINNNVTNITDLLNDTQQPGKKANGKEILALGGAAEENTPLAAADVTVTLSAGSIAAAAIGQLNVSVGNQNAQAVQSRVNQNGEAAQAIRAYNNANQAAANNYENMIQNQQPPGQTQKTINRLGGA